MDTARQANIERCKNWIMDLFSKRLPCPGLDTGITSNVFWDLAESSGVWERGTYGTPMSDALQELTKVDIVQYEDGRYCCSVFRLLNPV